MRVSATMQHGLAERTIIKSPLKTFSRPSPVATRHRRNKTIRANRGHAGSTDFTGPGRSGHAGFSPSSKKESRWDSNHLKSKLAAAGLSGIAAYGIFNTMYYASAFILVWYGVARVPRGQGLAAAAAAATKTLAVVWAGSQVTKLPRAGGALLAAPAVDKLLSFLKNKFRLRGKQQAFMYFIVPACWVLIASVMGGSILLWA